MGQDSFSLVLTAMERDENAVIKSLSGRGRGSIPPGLYRVGRAEDHPYLGGKAFALSDVFDPLVKDVRNALFMHVGTRSSGCIAIDPRQYRKFIADMAVVEPSSFELVLSRSV